MSVRPAIEICNTRGEIVGLFEAELPWDDILAIRVLDRLPLADLVCTGFEPPADAIVERVVELHAATIPCELGSVHRVLLIADRDAGAVGRIAGTRLYTPIDLAEFRPPAAPPMLADDAAA